MRTDVRSFDLVWRVTAVVVAGLCAALAAPTWLATVLALVAAVAAVEPLARRRGLGWVDGLLVGVAGVLIALVLLGLVLDLLPAGLFRVPWAVGASVLALTAILFSQPPSTTAPTLLSSARLAKTNRRRLLRTAPWYVAAAAMAAVAIIISVHATNIANRPPVQLSAVDRPATGEVVVQVSGGQNGSFELVVEGSTVRYGPFALTGDQTHRFRIPVTAARTVVALREVNNVRDIRSLVLTG